MILFSLLELVQNLGDKVKHLDPKAIYILENGFSLCKVICADKRIFQDVDSVKKPNANGFDEFSRD